MVFENQICCGCTACATVCPRMAITMAPDSLGFLYPVVDHEKCSRCRACIAVCPLNNEYDKGFNLRVPEAYGACHKSIDEVMNSRSGAVFVALSDYVIDHGGVVYGAGYADHFRVVHKRAETKTERDEFRCSKYVQSDLGDVFARVKEDLLHGLTVLFSGTPCQTAGLAAVIKMPLRANLFLVDIICHGVASPGVWHEYLNYIERRHGGRIVSVQFRDKKRFGWAAHRETFTFRMNGETDETYCPPENFYRDVFINRACSKCSFATLRRPSDITLGDFWGWEKSNPIVNNGDRGLNLVLVNTAKGGSLFDSIKGTIVWFPVELWNVLQTHLCSPPVRHPTCEKFVKVYAHYGFEYAVGQCVKFGMTRWERNSYKSRLVVNKLRRKVKELLVRCGLVY